MQRKVDGVGCKTAEEFKASILHSLANRPKEELYNLFRSMKGEVSKCVKKIVGRQNIDLETLLAMGGVETTWLDTCKTFCSKLKPLEL